MTRLYVLLCVSSVCIVCSSAVQFGRSGLAAGLLVVGVACLAVAGRVAKVMGDGRS